jgi:hypothetical protein
MQMPSIEYHTPTRVSWTQRINFRLLAFAAIILALIGYPVYLYLDTRLSGGVWDRGDYVEVDLKSISLFDFDQIRGTDEQIPARYRALDGRRVKIKGEMYSGTQSAGKPADFDVVYSISKCCVVGQPLIQHFVKATVVPESRGKIRFLPGYVNVWGTFHVGVERDPQDGTILSIYRIDVESVQPAR